ncbi:MAG: metallophosphoesterase family protein [Solirubrobacteraceae bacterium]
MGNPHLSLRALILADERPYLPLERLLERRVDVVLCLGDLTRHDIEALGSVQLPKLGVHGNHDDGGEFTGLGIENVHLKRIEVAGLCFGGFSGSHEYGREPRYTWSQKQAAKLLRKLGPVDVLLAHSPPLGVNDDPDDPAHIGLRGLRDYLERERPAMMLHGHTYPPLPVERWGDTEIRHVRGHRFVTLPAPG